MYKHITRGCGEYIMDTIFHILDCQIRDETVEAEDAETREVSYEDIDEDDEEVVVLKKKSTSKLNPNARVVIHLFGSTATGQHVRCNVRGFEPFFYIRLPDGDRGIAIRAKAAVEAYIGRMLGAGALELITLTVVQKKELFGYHAHKSFSFLEIRVVSMNAFQQVKNIFLNDKMEPCIGGKWKAGRESLGAPFAKGESPRVYESNLDPLLRFFHLRNISPCNWVRVQGGGEAKRAMDVHEVDCLMDDIFPCANPPAATAPFRVASWDIECWSSTGEFPLAERKWSHIVRPFYKASESAVDFCNAIVTALQGNETEIPKGCYNLSLKKEPKGIQETTLDTLITKMNKLCSNTQFCDYFEKDGSTSKEDHETNIQSIGIYLEKHFASQFALMGDPIIQIGVIVTRLGSTDAERHIFVLDTCSEVPGAVVHSYKDEKTLLLEWCKWVHKNGVDILIGYNIFGFDEVYFWNRIVYYGLEDNEAVQNMNRLCDLGGIMKLDEKRLSSSAMGDNFLYLWNTTGRLRIDLYHYIKRNNALGSYKLDDTSRYFLGEKVKGIDVGGKGEDSGDHGDSGKWTITVDLTKSKQGAAVGRSLVFMNDEGITLCDKLNIHSIDKENGRMIVDAPADVEVLDVEKWAIVKDDLSPAEMFKLHLGTADDRAIIAKYCVQDCALVLDLFRKLEVFNNAMSMANVCSVPIGYIFIRGQGIKIESLIFKFCYENGQCIQVLPGASGNQSSYEGAIVLDPTPGFYTVPVGVADFASLYPSTIISENISHDTLVWVKEYDNDMNYVKTVWGNDAYDNYPGVLYTDIQFDNYEEDPHDTRKNKAKIKTGVRVCRYAQDAIGTIPQITAKLLAQRKATRKLIEKEPDMFRKALLDAEQLAYKVTANSLYGQLGSATFKVRLQSLAASVTAYGRKQIMFAKDMIMEFYGPQAKNPRCTASGAETVYGDSVKGDTPLYLRKDGKSHIVRIDELEEFSGGKWTIWHETKECINLTNIETWTERGWTKLHRLIRHKLMPGKKMYRIVTHTGVVDCTEDHSLVNINGDEIKPSDVTVGTELLHNDSFWKEFQGSNCNITEGEAWAMGLFLADGSSDAYNVTNGIKYTWAINKANMSVLEEAQHKLPFETKILNTLESSGVYKLVPVGNIKDPAIKYRELFYNIHREKCIPECILNAPDNIVKSFMDGFYTGDGDKVGQQSGNYRWDQKGKQVCSGLYILAKRVGYSISINDRATKPDVFRITCTKSYQRKNNIAIKKMYEIPTNNIDYVYDLQTENHHFSVGPGALVVHNTDSLFICFNPKNPTTGAPLEGRDAVEATIHLTEEAGKLVSQALKPPHDFEFDKVYWPFLIFSKKRYVGNLYESNPDDYYQKSMGIALKRRDYAPIVKKVYGGAVQIMLGERDVAKAANYVRESCNDLVNGKWGLGPLTISKSIRAEYANPNAIAHKVLADRMAARDPGNAPASGDRIPYVYILPPAGQKASDLQGDRIEAPSYIREKGLKPDFMFYITNQISNPVCQMFGLLLEHMPGYPGEPVEGWPVEESARSAVRENMAYKLLFSEAEAISCGQKTKAWGERFGFKVIGSVGNGGGSGRGSRGTIAVTPVPTTTTVKRTALHQTTLDGAYMDRLTIEALKKPRKKATSKKDTSACIDV